jgi:hypothetical protein
MEENYEQLYHRVMSLLKATRMEHGLCEPRSRRACTHCNAKDDLDKLLAEYKGARIRVLSFGD